MPFRVKGKDTNVLYSQSHIVNIFDKFANAIGSTFSLHDLFSNRGITSVVPCCRFLSSSLCSFCSMLVIRTVHNLQRCGTKVKSDMQEVSFGLKYSSNIINNILGYLFLPRLCIGGSCRSVYSLTKKSHG